MKSHDPRTEEASLEALNELIHDSPAATTESARDQKTKSLLKRFLGISVYAIVTLYVFLLAPLYVRLANDILYMSTLWPDLLNLLLSVADIAVFAIAYAVILFAIYRFPMRHVRGILLIYGGSILYRNLGNLLMTYLVDGIPVKDEISFDLFSVLAYIVLEALQCGLVVYISHKVISMMKKQEEIRIAAALKLSKKNYKPLVDSFPFDRLFSFKRPVQKLAQVSLAFTPL